MIYKQYPVQFEAKRYVSGYYTKIVALNARMRFLTGKRILFIQIKHQSMFCEQMMEIRVES